MESRSATAGYAVPGPDDVGGRASGGAWPRAFRTLGARYRATSLYVRVVVINGAILVGATLVLVLSPATVGYPIRLTELLVLVGGVLSVVIANALVLRLSFAGLASTVARMETVDLLRPQQRLPAAGGPETRAVVAGLNTMLARLEDERRESARRTLSALEGERRRIARELHDEVGQRLTGMLLQLGNLVPDSPAEVSSRVAAIQEDARAALDEVGQLAWQLRPGILDDLGLLRALEALVDNLDAQATRVHVSGALPRALPPLPPGVELVIYRIVQEALTNAARHASAGEVQMRVELGDDALSVVVCDDGVGFVLGQAEGAGIRGMRERALAIEGTLTIDAPPAGGTRVRLDVPLPAPA